MGTRFPTGSQHDRRRGHGTGIQSNIIPASNGLSAKLTDAARRIPWKEILISLAIAGVIVLAALPSLSEPAARDQGVYLYAGRQILQGKVLHRDVFDQRPPGMPLVYTLGMALFGESMYGVRLMDLIWCLLTAGAIYLVGRQVFGRTAGILAALLFGLAYELFFNWWDSAQCDGLMTLPLILAIYFALRAEARGRAGPYVVAGIFCGVGFWFKPNAAWIALALGLVALFRRPFRAGFIRAAALTAGFAGVALVIVIGYWLFDALTAMFEAVFVFNLTEYVRPTFDLNLLRNTLYWTGRFLLKTYLLLFLAGVAAIWALMRRRNRQIAILLAWLGASLMMVWTQWKFFGYHWIPVVAPLAVLAGGGGILLWRWFGPARESRQLWAGRLVIVTLLVISLSVYVWRYAPEFDTFIKYQRGFLSEEAYLGQFVRKDFNYLAIRDVAGAVAEMTAPSDKVLMWGFEPLVLFLANREAPTRYSFTYPLTSRRDGPRDSKWNDDFLRDIQAEPPSVIVLGTRDRNPLQPVSSLQQVQHWPALWTFMMEHYALDSTVAGYRLYRWEGNYNESR